MKIEAGKYYRLRNNKKWFVVGRCGFIPFDSDASEKVWVGTFDWENFDWHNGKGQYDSKAGDSPYDIVAEWEERAPLTIEAWVGGYSYPVGNLMLAIFPTKEHALYYHHGNQNAALPPLGNGFKLRKIRYTEGGKIEDVTDE